MHLLARLFWAMLFVAGLVYATSTLVAEHFYAAGMPRAGLNLDQQIYFLRLAGQFNPFDTSDRDASARILAVAAIQLPDRKWSELARLELIRALEVDYSSADLLLKLVAVDLKLGNKDEAKIVFQKFKRADPKSPLTLP